MTQFLAQFAHGLCQLVSGRTYAPGVGHDAAKVGPIAVGSNTSQPGVRIALAVVRGKITGFGIPRRPGSWEYRISSGVDRRRLCAINDQSISLLANQHNLTN